MATKNWKSGRTGDFNTAGNWQGGIAPVAYDIAIIGTGKATLLSQGETLPENLDIRLGAQISPLSSIFSGASSTSNLAITNNTIDQSETIGVIAAGGQISDLSLSNPAILGGMGVTGTVDFAGTINVEAGDALVIGIASPTATPGLFDNTGTINVTGTLGNYALVITHQGNQGSTGPGAADYGTVNLSYGFFIAEAPDAISSTVTGQFTLSNDSALAIGNTIFTHTNVDFADTTDTLLLGQDAANQYWFGDPSGGRIQNFQVGDTIALLASTTSAAIPASWSYSATTGALSLFNASDTLIGMLYLAGNYAAAHFSISPAIPSPISGYGNGYEITLDPATNPNFWVSGATGDIDTAANWLGGAVPASGADATLQAGEIDIGAGDGVPSDLTLHVGTTVVDGVGAPSVSNIVLKQTTLPSDLTIDNTGAGDVISSTAYSGPAIESALNAIDSATTDATINVGAGDVELFNVSASASNPGPAYFDNEGAINLRGAPGNVAVALFGFGETGAYSAFYGAVNLSHGFLFANLSDTPVAGVTPRVSYLSLSNSSDVYAAAALQSVNVRFADGSGNRLDLAPQSSGDAYQFGGAIYNFQSGDVIALQENTGAPTLTIESYDPVSGLLTISDGAADFGLHIFGNFGAIVGAQTTSSLFHYAGEYDITVSPANYTWTGGTADFATPGAWTGTTSYPPDGASAATPTIATIGAGTVRIGAADTAPANITFNVGALTLDAQTSSQPASVLSVTDNSLGQGVTLDNTATGGDFPVNGTANLFLSALDVYGTVNFAGTINVGAGDGEFIKITPDSSTTTDAGFFNNTGAIDLTGTAGNQAAMIVSQGGPNGSYLAGGFANYGTVNLSYGLFLAEAPDSIPNPPRNGGGHFTLTNDSQLAIVNTIFNQSTVTFGDGTDTLLLGEDGSNQYWFGGGANGVVAGLQAGDTIALAENGASAIPASLKYSYVKDGSGVLRVFNASDQSIGQIAIADPNGLFTTANFVGTQTDSSNLGFTGEYDIIFTICFMAGTRIRTPDGEVAVEKLQRGGLVLTADGAARPVNWLGRQTVATRFADPLRVCPIRVKAGALGENVPARDLLLSPDHALLVEDVLIHAGALVNGTSIVRETSVPEVFTYYHVELDDHSLILAENTPAETFIDNVERLAFDNWAEHEALYPEGKTIEEMASPRAKGRRQVPAHIRAWIDGRAKVLGLAEARAAA